MRNRLFTARLDRIAEHPPGLSIVGRELPAGPLAAWEAYAPNWDGDRMLCLGPFTPTITRDEDNACIKAPDGTEYHFIEPIGGEPACWYQSGSKLRFVPVPGKTQPAESC